MKLVATAIPEVVLIESRIFQDERGYFFESHNAKELAGLGITPRFVQDNVSWSHRNVLRGLHYQITSAQGKLIRVLHGEIFDVAVDLRRTSPTFSRWIGERLSAENHRAIFIPEGFAHGFLALTDEVIVHYKTTDFYAPAAERTIVWNDADLAIDWPLGAG